MKKIYTILISLSFFLTSKEGFSQNFSWSNFTTGGLSYSKTSSGITMNMTIAGTGLQSGYPYYVSASGGYLYAAVDWANNTSSLTFTFTFSKPVIGAKFLIYDVDQSSTWDDKITITALNQSNTTVYPTITGSAVASVSGTNGNIVEGTANNINTTSNPVSVSFGSKAIQSFKLTYATGSSSPSNPVTQVIGIGTLTYANVLPLDLLSFKAEKRNTDADLKWEADNMVNFSHFEIERSATGTGGFEKIGMVTTNGVANGRYSYTDMNVQQKMSKAFYRLRMVDIDGAFKYSSVMMVNFNATMAVDVRPTLLTAGEAIRVNISGSTLLKYDVKLFDMTGKLVTQKNQVNGQVQFETTSLGKGIYIMTINGGIKPETFRITVQ